MKIIIQCGNPNNLIWASPTTFYFPEKYILHPKLHIEFVEGLIKDFYVKEKFHQDYFQNDEIYIITNSEHIINRFRVAKKENEIKQLLIQFFPFDVNKSMIEIKTDSKGELSEYPIDFLDEWSNQLLKLI